MSIDEVAEITQKLNLATPKMYLFALNHYPDIVDEVGDVGRYNECREFYNFPARKMKVKK